MIKFFCFNTILERSVGKTCATADRDGEQEGGVKIQQRQVPRVRQGAGEELLGDRDVHCFGAAATMRRLPACARGVHNRGQLL